MVFLTISTYGFPWATGLCVCMCVWTRMSMCVWEASTCKMLVSPAFFLFLKKNFFLYLVYSIS